MEKQEITKEQVERVKEHVFNSLHAFRSELHDLIEKKAQGIHVKDSKILEVFGEAVKAKEAHNIAWEMYWQAKG